MLELTLTIVPAKLGEGRKAAIGFWRGLSVCGDKLAMSWAVTTVEISNHPLSSVVTLVQTHYYTNLRVEHIR